MNRILSSYCLHFTAASLIGIHMTLLEHFNQGWAAVVGRSCLIDGAAEAGENE